MLTNYHTHCDLCKHAEGSVEVYVQQAIIDKWMTDDEETAE